MVQAVNAVQQTAALSRIPETLKAFSFFGNYDLWEYYELGDPDSECEHCKQYSSKTFVGSELRAEFPDLIIEDQDTIYPNVHMTLWGVDTCKCLLIRVNKDKVDLESLVFFSR